MKTKLAAVDRLAEEIAESRKQAKEGKVYSQEQIMKKLGLLKSKI